MTEKTHDGNGNDVEWAVALAAWERAARPILERCAREYHATITYGELADAVQTEADIYTKSLPGNWIGKVAFNVHLPGEPLLSSVLTDADGYVSTGFAGALIETYGVPEPEDLQLAAAEEREKVYRYFDAPTPADGGAPSFPKRLQAIRNRAKKATPRPPVVCPVHHLQLPLSGQCDLCD